MNAVLGVGCVHWLIYVFGRDIDVERRSLLCDNRKGEVQQPLKTEQARNLTVFTFTRMAQQHHHESLSQHKRRQLKSTDTRQYKDLTAHLTMPMLGPVHLLSGLGTCTISRVVWRQLPCTSDAQTYTPDIDFGVEQL